MYQTSKDTILDAALVKDAIEYNEKRRKRFDRLDNYYIGQQDIFNRKRSGTEINNQVMTNHAKYIVDMNIGYLLGNPVDYQVTEGLNIEPLLKHYNRQKINNLDVDIAKEAGIFGLKYEYVYADEESRPCSVALDVRNTIIIYDNTMLHKPLYGVNYRPVFDDKAQDDTPQYYEILVASDKEIMQYELRNDRLKQISKSPHSFGEVPMIEYHNNGELLGDFETVLSLIDAYNLYLSDRVNENEQLVDAAILFYGMNFDEEQMAQFKERRALSNIPTDGKVEYLSKTVNEADLDVLRQNIEKDIHKISMVPNLTDENFVGNSSGVALRYKLLAFEQNTKNKERYFEVGLTKRFELYSNFLAAKNEMKKIGAEDVDVVFKRNLPTNDYEISQMINNLVGLVDKELLVAQLSFVKDASETVETAEKDQKATDDEPNDEDFGSNEIADRNETGTGAGVESETTSEPNEG